MQITNQSGAGSTGRRAEARDVQFVEAAGTNIATAVSGSGRPALCLHATGHDGKDFEPFAARMMGQGVKVVRADWPGHGASPMDKTGAAVSAQRYAEIAIALAEKVSEKQPCIIIGNSIGGMAAIRVAALHPEKVRALVLANPGGLAPLDIVSRTAIAVLKRFFTAGARNAFWFRSAFAAYYQLILPGPTMRCRRREIVAASADRAELIAQAWSSFSRPDADLREELARLRCPVLFAWAMNDRIVSWKRSAPAISCFERGQVERFDGGHTAFLEDPDAFADAFLRFVDDLSNTDRSPS